MERKRARLPHSDSGRLICPNAILTNHGAAAKAPIETSAIAAAWRIEGLILSAINMPRPRPMAVRVTMSNGSTGSCSAVFKMDIGRDIIYHICLVLKKETGIFAAWQIRSTLILHRHGQSDLRAHSRRRQRRTILASKSPGPSEATASPRLQKNSARRNRGAT